MPAAAGIITMMKAIAMTEQAGARVPVIAGPAIVGPVIAGQAPSRTRISPHGPTNPAAPPGACSNRPETEIGTCRRIPLLRLFAWLSPAFPTGGFAYSHGLEWAVEVGDVADGAMLQDWLSDVIAHGAGRTDTVLLRHAHRASADPDALVEIAELARATAPSRERQAEALDQGRAFALAAGAWGMPVLPARTPYAVAIGALAGRHGIDEGDTAAAYLQAFATNLISAAVRLVPLGQTVGLGVLASLEPIILETAAATRAATLDDLGGCAFRSDLSAMRHETQYTRLFRS